MGFIMLFALGAVSSALDLLGSPSQGLSPQNTSGANPFAPAAGTNSPPPVINPAPTGVAQIGPSTGGQLAPQTFNTLLSAQPPTEPRLSPEAALQNLFSLIDADGDGKITKAEFESALGAGGTNLQAADNVFSQIDKNGDGSITLDELKQALEGPSGGHHHHGHHVGAEGGGGGGNDALAQALQGATATTVTNSDGSTTTTLSYADGTKITMTQPAAAGTSSSTTNNAVASYNYAERLIQREAQWITANTAQSVSLSA
jgi:EF-hand domain pair